MARVSKGAGLLLLTAALGHLGCGPWSGTTAPGTAERPFQGERITIAAVGDASLAKIVIPLLGEWQESRRAEAAVNAKAVEPLAARETDVLLFSADRLGDLVDAQALAVLPESVVRPPASKNDDEANAETAPPDPLAFRDVVESYRDEVTRYGEDRMALPLGGSALVLVYRRDAFEREANRQAAKQAGLTLEPPTTWEGLDALARFFHGRDWNGKGHEGAGIALTFQEGAGNDIFLARSAALGLRTDQYSFLFDAETMTPRITLPPFVEAARAFSRLASLGPEGAAEFHTIQAREAFRTGKVALLIDRAERWASWSSPETPIAVGVAALPGSERLYDPDQKTWTTSTPPNRPSYLPHGGGWLAGISAAATGRRRDAAIDFLKYLTSPETSARLLADPTLPMLPVRASQIAQGPPGRLSPGLDARSWSNAVSETLTAARVVPGLRIPQTEDYLTDLGQHRAQASMSTDDPGSVEDALTKAAKAWTERTDKLGLDRQRWHYRRSLNKYPTSPEPPAAKASR
ncbi:MAG: extracellular solute-binding protein [Isosphaeraceae bacterium]